MTQIPAGLCGIFPNPNPVYEATARQEVIEHRLFNERKRTMTELDIPLHKAIERILDDHSAWIARPNDEVTRSIARLAIIAVHEIISERDALSATPAQDDAVLDSYADENQRLSDRIEDLEAEVAALNRHFDAAYEAAGLSRSSSKPLAHHIMELLAATPAVGREREAAIEECAKLIESGAGMADLIDQEELDQQAKYIRALPDQLATSAIKYIRALAAKSATSAIGVDHSSLAVRLGHMSKWFTDQSYEAITLREARDALAATPAVGGEELIWPPEEMASLMDALARSADRYNSSYGETAHLARNAAKTIRALTVQPEYLTGCLHPGDEPGGCQYEGGCQSESCAHYNKTEYRPRRTLLAQVDGILYPKVER